MRILHVVTLVSQDGAYGGPLRVALNQSAELRRRGHEVHLAAGWRGVGPVPTSMQGMPAFLFAVRRLVPQKGFSGLISPGLARWLLRNVRRYDLVHVHAGRDLVSVSSMAIVRLLGQVYVTQTHGMVQPDERASTRLLDAMLVRRLLRSARCRFVLTDEEASGLRHALGPASTLQLLVNGVPRTDLTSAPSDTAEVLFCARLHKRKRPLVFVELADQLRDRVSAQFVLIGADEGELAAVEQSITTRGLQDRVRYEGSLDYDQVEARMSRAAVYVLPSVNEPFPMSLLEALALGLPSVCTDTCGISDVLQRESAAIVTDGSVDAMAAAVLDLLQDEDLRRYTSIRARQAVHRHFSMQVVGDHLEEAYGRAVDHLSGRPSPSPGELGSAPRAAE